MMSNDMAHHFHDRRRPARSLMFALGLLTGLLIGVAASFAIPDMQHAAPPWSSALVCRGHIGDIFFIENDTGRDYHLETDFVLMQQAGIGLVPTEARAIIPVFIPQAETAGMKIEDAPKTGLILFDLRNRVRVALN